MPTTRFVRTAVAAAAVAVGLVATAAPAQAGWGVRVGFSAALVAPPLVVSVGNVPPAPYFRPYAAGCYLDRAYAPYYAPTYAPYVAPYAARVVVGPRAAYGRVWVPGPRPHWEMRRVARFHRDRW
ncbi:MAG TPA: hypothetical protein VMT19_11245 [Thermoanaerobaculaceae bacterium]|nr:hypothetical protein [Thermoanaerobaculaceae bacterium]